MKTESPKAHCFATTTQGGRFGSAPVFSAIGSVAQAPRGAAESLDAKFHTLLDHRR